jgi:hypothetical protein
MKTEIKQELEKAMAENFVLAEKRLADAAPSARIPKRELSPSASLCPSKRQMRHDLSSGSTERHSGAQSSGMTKNLELELLDKLQRNIIDEITCSFDKLKESSVDPIAAVAATGGEEPNPINGTLDS